MNAVCDISGKAIETRGNRLPSGWRKFQGKTWSGDAWKQHFRCVALTIPVAEPLDGEWKEFRESLRKAWGLCTNLANWQTSQMFAADYHRDGNDDKLPKAQLPYLYPAARERFPDLPTGSLCALMHAVEGRYRKRRYAVNWTADESLANYRYPVPYPVRAQNWTPKLTEDGCPMVEVTLPDRRWRLRLFRGKGFDLQVESFKRLVSGEGLHVEMSLYRQRSESSDRRQALQERNPGGDQRTYWRIMAKVVCWLPKKTSTERKGTLKVRTGDGSFLTAAIANGAGDSRVWRYNGWHIRRHVRAHAIKLQALSDDRKAERRRPRRKSLQIQHYTDDSCHRQKMFLRTTVDQVSAWLVNYADRRKIACIDYNDTDRSYVDSFPWAELRDAIARKADAAGIEFVSVNSEEEKNDESGD